MNRNEDLAPGGTPAVSAFTNEGGKDRPAREEELGVSFSDLGEVTITRGRALKLAGAALAGSALSLLWAGEADARRRRRRRRRRKRKAKVNNYSSVLGLTLAPGLNTLNVTNPSANEALTIKKIELLDDTGKVIDANVLTGPVTIGKGLTKDVTVNVDADDLVNADRLRLIDGRGMPITVIDKDGVEVKDIDVDVL